MKTSNRLIYFALAILMSFFYSCKVGESYVEQDRKVPEGFRKDGESLKDSINIARLSWKEFFEDPMLISLIEQGLSENLDIKIAEKDALIGFENLQQRKANFFPNLVASPNYYTERHGDNWYSNPNAKIYERKGTAPPSVWYNNRIQHLAPVSSSWEIDIWGKLRNQKEAAASRYQASLASLKALQTNLVAEISSTYYNLLRLDEQLEVAKSNLALNDSTINIVRLQYRAGQVTSLAILQTENQKLLAASLIPQIEKEIAQEENYLRSLLGEYPGEIPRSQSLEPETIKTKEAAGIPIELLKNRPDVLLSEYNLMAAYSDLGAAKAARYPSLTLAGTMGLDSYVLANLFQPASLFANLGAGITAPIFQNRRLKTDQRKADLEKQIASDQFQQTIIQAVAEVSNELTNLEKIKEEHAIALQRIDASKLAVKNASLLFKSGMANYLEVINAQSNALDNELNLINVKMDLLIANLQLYRALGGGWEE